MRWPPATQLIPLTIALLFSCCSTKGQDTVLIKPPFKVTGVYPTTRFFTSASITRADSAYQFFLQCPEKTYRQTKPFIGIVKEPYWFLISLKNQSQLTRFIFLIKHAHLRHIELYEIRNNKVLYKNTVGELYPFAQRPLPNRNFAFPLELAPNESCDLLLYVDHENSLALPTSLWNEASFYENDYTFNLVAGAGVGFLLFCTFISFVSFIIIRNTLFLWYCLYLLLTAFYLFTDLGFSFQYLFPSLARVDGPISIYSPLLMFIGLIKFIQQLLSLNQYHKRINKWLTSISLLFLLLMLIDSVFQESFRQYSFYILPVVFSVVLLGAALLLLAATVSLKTKRKMAIFFFISYIPLLTLIVFTILGNGFGLVTYTFLNPFYLGILIEVMVLTIALISQYKDIHRERSQLQSKIVEQQKEYYQTYIDGIEKERNRIAGDLHDDVGSKLSHLKRAAFSSENENSKLLDEVIQDLRNISHDLAPTIAKVSGFVPLLERLISRCQIETEIKINLRVFDFRECLSPDQTIQLYRILQEVINNAIKHSDATQIDIQVFGYEKEMSISIEDDGKGFDVRNSYEGLGLNQLKVRAENLNARIEINSKLGNGTLIILQVPLKAL